MVSFHSTTIVAVKTADGIAMAGDGQVTMGETTIMKGTARKVRRLYNDTVIAGFAGSVADAFILFDKFENYLDQCHGQLSRAAVELAKEWYSEKATRNLEALLLLADKNDLFIVSGNGEVIVPDEGIAAIGSGGNFALAAARALKQNTDLPANEIARKALEIAASICVYTNDNIIVEEIKGATTNE